jgi:hypothetical protein
MAVGRGRLSTARGRARSGRAHRRSLPGTAIANRLPREARHPECTQRCRSAAGVFARLLQRPVGCPARGTANHAPQAHPRALRARGGGTWHRRRPHAAPRLLGALGTARGGRPGRSPGEGAPPPPRPRDRSRIRLPHPRRCSENRVKGKIQKRPQSAPSECNLTCETASRKRLRLRRKRVGVHSCWRWWTTPRIPRPLCRRI